MWRYPYHVTYNPKTRRFARFGAMHIHKFVFGLLKARYIVIVAETMMTRNFS